MRFYSMNKRSLICINQSKSCKIHKITIKKILRLFSPFHFQDLYTGDDFFTFWFPTNHNKMVSIKTETVMASSGSNERRQRERYFSYAICCWAKKNDIISNGQNETVIEMILAPRVNSICGPHKRCSWSSTSESRIWQKADCQLRVSRKLYYTIRSIYQERNSQSNLL